MRYEGNKLVLTESELHNLVNESVRVYLNEMDEGVTGFLSGMFDRGSKQAQNTGRNLRNSVSNTYGKVRDYATKQYGRAKQGVQNYKMAGQVSSINQDAQKAINNSINSLTTLLELNTKLQGITGYAALGEKLVSAITNCLNVLKTEGNLTMGTASGQFAAQRSTAVNPNAEFYERK